MSWRPVCQVAGVMAVASKERVLCGRQAAQLVPEDRELVEKILRDYPRQGRGRDRRAQSAWR